MPEIFLLCEYPTLNGGERSMLSTLDGVRAAGFTPTVLAPPDGPLAEALATRGIELLSFSCRTVDGTRIDQARLREELAALLTRRRPALLHANSLAMGRLSGPVAAELGLPSLAHLRDILSLSRQAVADLNCHTRLLAVSNATRAFHVAQGMAAEKVHVLYNGVDLDAFQPRPPTGYLHRELQLPPDVVLVGTIGQLGLRKGQDVLLRAAGKLQGCKKQEDRHSCLSKTARLTHEMTDRNVCPPDKAMTDRNVCPPDKAATPLHSASEIAGDWPNVHYLLVGERNSDKDESRQFERDLRATAEGALAGRVHFLGRRTDMPRLLNELTLLVHSARQEPLGRVLLEAAAAGVAIVATNVGGTAEIFPPECDAACVVPPNDADALAEAMCSLLTNGELRERLSSAARRRAVAQFDIRTAVGNLLEHYRSML